MKRRSKSDNTVELVIDCNLCGSKKNMEYNLTKRLYHCWACGRGGRLSDKSVEAFLPFVASESSRNVELLTSTTSLQRKSPVDDIPEYALKAIERRGLSPQWVITRYRVKWDGDRLCFPCGSGWSRRSVFPWQEPKTIIDSPRDILGGHLLYPGAHVVITEGDFKSASIPLPWVGVGLCGKVITELQAATILLSRPASITISLDGGELDASRLVASRLRPLDCKILNIPEKGLGPDDIPRRELVPLLLAGSGPESPGYALVPRVASAARRSGVYPTSESSAQDDAAQGSTLRQDRKEPGCS